MFAEKYGHFLLWISYYAHTVYYTISTLRERKSDWAKSGKEC